MPPCTYRLATAVAPSSTTRLVSAQKSCQPSTVPSQGRAIHTLKPKSTTTSWNRVAGTRRSGMSHSNRDGCREGGFHQVGTDQAQGTAIVEPYGVHVGVDTAVGEVTLHRGGPQPVDHFRRYRQREPAVDHLGAVPGGPGLGGQRFQRLD